MKPLFNHDHSINLPGYVVQKESPPSFFRRALALVIDLYIGIMIFLFPFNSLLKTYMPTQPSLLSPTTVPFIVQAIVYFFLIMVFFYIVCMQYIFGQTLGMMLMRYRIKGQKENFAFWQIVVRNLFLFPLFPLSFIWMLELLHYMFYGERLLERLSRTHVASNNPSQILTQIEL